MQRVGGSEWSTEAVTRIPKYAHSFVDGIAKPTVDTLECASLRDIHALSHSPSTPTLVLGVSCGDWHGGHRPSKAQPQVPSRVVHGGFFC
jgi:hypothetical protein